MGKLDQISVLGHSFAHGLASLFMSGPLGAWPILAALGHIHMPVYFGP